VGEVTSDEPHNIEARRSEKSCNNWRGIEIMIRAYEKMNTKMSTCDKQTRLVVSAVHDPSDPPGLGCAQTLK